MFLFFDINNFGERLREIRNSLKITRKEIQDQSGITIETLRRIENGLSVPRLDTLYILSSLYKYNLVDLLNESNESNKYYRVLDEIDNLILYENLDKLKDISYDNYSMYFENIDVLEDNREKEQFKMFLDVIGKTYSNNIEDKLESIEILIDILKINHDDFEIADFRDYIYSFFELRILIILGVTYAEIKEYELSNELLEYLSDYLTVKNNISLQKYYLKVLSNLSCNYHCLNNNEKALDIANQGIEYCMSMQSFYLLEIFYYRKAVALFLIENKVYYNIFENIKQILTIQGRFNTLRNLKEFALNIYNIEF